MLRGQAAVEYVSLLSVLLLVFLVFYFILAQSHQKEASQDIWVLSARSIAMEVGETIDRVHVAGDGSNQSITVPKRLPGGVNYSVSVYSHMVLVSVPDYGREFEWKMQTSQVNGSENGFEVVPGSLNVFNWNGTIYIQWV